MKLIHSKLVIAIIVSKVFAFYFPPHPSLLPLEKEIICGNFWIDYLLLASKDIGR